MTTAIAQDPRDETSAEPGQSGSSPASRAPGTASGAEASPLEPGAAGLLGELERDVRRLMRDAGEARFAVDQTRRESREHTRALLLGVLDAADALDRVFASAAARPDDVTPQMRIWLNNFRTARLLLGRVLEDQGLSRFAPGPGEAFDPHWHRVSGTAAAPERPEGSVLEVSTAGYLWDGALLRKAAVVVVQNQGESRGESTGP